MADNAAWRVSCTQDAESTLRGVYDVCCCALLLLLLLMMT